jgi:hypothetical protein
MSTKRTTTSTNQYDPGAEQGYNMLQPQATGANAQMISNPYNNAFINNQRQMGAQFNNQLGVSSGQQIAQNLQSNGLPQSGALANFMQRRAQFSQMANNANMNNNLLLNAGNLRQQAIGSGMSYNPQQTGSTNTQYQSGLGTWLPQLAHAALQAGEMAAGGG